jgi:antitoxin component of MazEF toxin-antitoxin module
VHAPYGPHRIGQNRQVALPADLMKLVDLQPGDQVYLQVNPDVEGTLVVIPVEVAARWFDKGRQLDQSQRTTSQPDDQRPARE